MSHWKYESNLRKDRLQKALPHTLPMALGHTALLVDMPGEINGAD